MIDTKKNVLVMEKWTMDQLSFFFLEKKNWTRDLERDAVETCLNLGFWEAEVHYQTSVRVQVFSGSFLWRQIVWSTHVAGFVSSVDKIFANCTSI